MRTYKPIRIVFLVVLVLIAVGAMAEDQMTRVQLGLGTKIDDSEVPLLLHDESVFVTAVFVDVAGLNGTVRTGEAPPADVLREARRSSVEFFEKSLEGNRQFIQEFLHEHSFEEIRRDEDLQEQAFSLLRFSNQLESGLRELRTGEPIVYGLEVVGPEDAIRSFRDEGELFSFAQITDSKRERMEAVKPRGLSDPSGVDKFNPSDDLRDMYELMVSKGQAKPE